MAPLAALDIHVVNSSTSGFVVIALALSATYLGLVLASEWALRQDCDVLRIMTLTPRCSAEIRQTSVGYSRLLVQWQVYEGTISLFLACTYEHVLCIPKLT